MSRKLNRIVAKSMVLQRPGFASVDNFASELAIEPFLVFTEFQMDRQIFGPHPHAGVSVLTYMLPDSPGSFRNRDSFGDDSIIEPGGAHVTQAGRGIQHDEVPTVEGVECHGMQIWINHSAANRLVEPKALHAMAADIPVVEEAGARIRVVLGSHAGATSPMAVVTPVSLFHMQSDCGSRQRFELPETAFVYVLAGSAKVGDEVLTAGTIGIFEPTEGEIDVVVEGETLIAGGTPHLESIVYGGPYVASTEEQMNEFRRAFGRGEMGQLAPLS